MGNFAEIDCGRVTGLSEDGGDASTYSGSLESGDHEDLQQQIIEMYKPSPVVGGKRNK